MSDFPTVLSLSEIDLSEIDSFDRRYQISLSEDNIDFLVQSIEETGLITPPVVRPVNNKLIIISGFNRIRAQLKTKKKNVLSIKPDRKRTNTSVI